MQPAEHMNLDEELKGRDNEALLRRLAGNAVSARNHNALGELQELGVRIAFLSAHTHDL